MDWKWDPISSVRRKRRSLFDWGKWQWKLGLVVFHSGKQFTLYIVHQYFPNKCTSSNGTVHSKQMKQVAFVVDAGVVINVLYDIYLSILSRMIFFFSWLFRLSCIDVSRRPAHPFRKHSRHLAVFLSICVHILLWRKIGSIF